MINKTKVFISSAMQPSAETDWPDLRHRVYSALDADEQFEPFAIENAASSMPSRQFFLSQVEQTDFVVCIVGKELGPGTNSELKFAFEKKKRVLLFS